MAKAVVLGWLVLELKLEPAQEEVRDEGCGGNAHALPRTCSTRAGPKAMKVEERRAEA